MNKNIKSLIVALRKQKVSLFLETAEFSNVVLGLNLDEEWHDCEIEAGQRERYSRSKISFDENEFALGKFCDFLYNDYVTWEHFVTFMSSFLSEFFKWGSEIRAFNEISFALKEMNYPSEDLLFLTQEIKRINTSKIQLQSVLRNIKVKKSKVRDMDKKKVFIVHGHDNESKHMVARFIENCGLKVVILSEQESKGATIIEKIEANSDVAFAIVLYTSCDVGGKTIENLRSRARQNVVWEHGFFSAKLGRENVVAMVEEGVETPSDMSGILYIGIDGGEGWKLKLIKELKGSGLDVDLNSAI